MDTNAPVTIIGPDEPDPVGPVELEDRNAEPIGAPKSSAGQAGSASGIPTIDPFNINAGNGGATPIDGKRGRGRPRGSTNRPKDGNKKAQVPGDIKVSVEDLLISCHEMIAAFVGAEELELDAEEAKQGAHHIKEVSRLYNHTFNPATLVWMGFIMWILTVYGTRGVAIYKRVTADAPAKVVPISAPKPHAQTPGPVPAPAASGKQPVVTNPSQLWGEAPDGSYYD